VPSLRACIDEALVATSAKRLAPTVERLTATYRAGDAATTPILSTAADALAYAAYRMPATYAVAHAVLSATQAADPDVQPETLVDFGAGTGAAFALLPAQNATGNWIKVVQRVPVRIAIDPQDLAAHPLQIGLSMQVEVDTRNREGARLPQIAQSAPAYATTVFQSTDSAANDRVKAIIAGNDGAPTRVVQSATPPLATIDRHPALGNAKAAAPARDRAL